MRHRPRPATRRRSVAIVVGHTPGHVLPGLAVGEAYRRALGDADLLVIEAAPGSVTRMLPPGPALYRLGRVEGRLRYLHHEGA